MAKKKIVLCDTDVIIDFYKNKATIVAELKNIGQPNIAISVVTAAELIYGAFNKRELQQIQKDIAHLQLIQINDKIGALLLDLLAKYSLSHNLALPDALIAATAIHFDIPLYTLNLKDFKFIKKLQLYK